MVIIGSRGSDLALWQARHVQALLRDRAELAAEIRIIKTEGDRDQVVVEQDRAVSPALERELLLVVTPGGVDDDLLARKWRRDRVCASTRCERESEEHERSQP